MFQFGFNYHSMVWFGFFGFQISLNLPGLVSIISKRFGLGWLWFGLENIIKCFGLVSIINNWFHFVWFFDIMKCSWLVSIISKPFSLSFVWF